MCVYIYWVFQKDIFFLHKTYCLLVFTKIWLVTVIWNGCHGYHVQVYKVASKPMIPSAQKLLPLTLEMILAKSVQVLVDCNLFFVLTELCKDANVYPYLKDTKQPRDDLRLETLWYQSWRFFLRLNNVVGIGSMFCSTWFFRPSTEPGRWISPVHYYKSSFGFCWKI